MQRTAYTKTALWNTFCPFDDHAVAGELLAAEGRLNGRHLLIVDGDAALLHQPARLTLEAARPHFTSRVSTSMLPPPKSSLVSSVVGHMLRVAAAGKQRP